jgi:RNA polymerase sigma factor (sigma-70 family)
VVLVQKASAMSGTRSLGPWLHKVAWRTATKARARSARRLAREVPGEVEPAVSDPPGAERRELGAVLEEELAQLPERYRRPVVLCYLEGMTNEEAARQLDCPKGTVLSRLSRARDQLRERLARRGLDLSSGILPAALASPPAPEALVEAVAQTGPLVRAGGAAGLSTSVMILAKGVMFSMFLRKLEVAGLLLLAMVLAASGASWLSHRPGAGVQAAPPIPPATKAEDKAPSAAKKDDKKTTPVKEGEKPQDLHTALAETVESIEINDPKTTLSEVLDMLAKVHRVTFDINEKAFKAEMINDVIKTPVAETHPIPSMKAPLRVVLNKILTRIPVPSGATFLVRKNHIEITTEAEAYSEIAAPEPQNPQNPLDDGGKYRLLPRVVQQFRKVGLEQALEEIADATGYNIVVDVRVEEKASVKVSARLMNVPVDTAVRLLADMAGLTVVRIDNVFYITSAENARKMATDKPVTRSGERQPRGGMPSGAGM